jgi:hypothetical protein
MSSKLQNNVSISLLIIMLFGSSGRKSKMGQTADHTIPPINKSLSLKPPMGWNSWVSFGFDVNEAEVMATADFIKKHVK